MKRSLGQVLDSFPFLLAQLDAEDKFVPVLLRACLFHAEELP